MIKTIVLGAAGTFILGVVLFPYVLYVVNLIKSVIRKRGRK